MEKENKILPTSSRNMSRIRFVSLVKMKRIFWKYIWSNICVECLVFTENYMQNVWNNKFGLDRSHPRQHTYCKMIWAAGSLLENQWCLETLANKIMLETLGRPSSVANVQYPSDSVTDLASFPWMLVLYLNLCGLSYCGYMPNLVLQLIHSLHGRSQKWNSDWCAQAP